MNPEERHLLQQTLELAEENNEILRKMQRAARWAMVWGFVKFLIIVIPLVIGFVILEPYFGSIQEMWDTLKELSNTYAQFTGR